MATKNYNLLEPEEKEREDVGKTHPSNAIVFLCILQLATIIVLFSFPLDIIFICVLIFFQIVAYVGIVKKNSNLLGLFFVYSIFMLWIFIAFFLPQLVFSHNFPFFCFILLILQIFGLYSYSSFIRNDQTEIIDYSEETTNPQPLAYETETINQPPAYETETLYPQPPQYEIEIQDDHQPPKYETV